MVSHAGSVKDRLSLAEGPDAFAGHGQSEARVASAASAKPAPARDLRSLFQAHYASIWRLLRRLGVQHAQLDDAAQEVFWVAARRFADIEPGREHAFLYGVALRVAAQESKRQKAADPLAELEAVPRVVDRGPSPEEQLEQRQARQLLDAVLDAMPPELRVVFVLFELEGLEVSHIAALQEIPLGTASSRLRRAREEFSASAKRVKATLAARERHCR
jgi:RNA polymerase sigma-70 factor (ECF subfamily)